MEFNVSFFNLKTATVLEVPIQNSIVVPLEADICDSTGPDNCVKANTGKLRKIYFLNDKWIFILWLIPANLFR